MAIQKKEFQELHQHLQNSFFNVKKDTQNLSQWVQHLNQKNQEQEHILQQLHQKTQQQDQHLRHLYQAQKPNSDPRLYHHLHQKIEHLSKKVDLLLENQQAHAQKLNHHSQKIEDFHQKLAGLGVQNARPKTSLKEKIIRTFSRHSKEYLKNLVFSYLEQHQKISALQLKDMIVDQQGLASKSSFYRILEEIESEGSVTVIKDGKQKIYLLKSLKSNH